MGLRTPSASSLKERFVLKREIGRGGMGVVYEVFDRSRDETVAFKTLLQLTASALYRFKQEFRGLADVVHPNLVTLYELHSSEDEWFFTMELVRGVHFTTWAHGLTEDPSPDGPSTLTRIESEPTQVTQTDDDAQGAAAVETPGRRAAASRPVAIHAPPPALDLPRLENSLRQLVYGLEALHAAGKVHRDIKPSNVLVAHSGRVVLLDFGLVADWDPGAPNRSLVGGPAGTPSYMAPEQIAGGPLTPAADWYAVGALLYETLTGRVPHGDAGEGWVEILQRRRSGDTPRPPQELAAGLPEHLCALTRELLQPDPLARPDGRELLRRLGTGPPLISGLRAGTVAGAPGRRLTPLHAPGPRTAFDRRSFVGRDGYLRLLSDALASVRHERAVALFVHAASGVGKTALVRHFVHQVAETTGAVVLEGRCHERESVPFKALDPLVDALGRYLKGLDPAEARSLLPRHAWALSRLFPSLSRVAAVAASQAPGTGGEEPEPQELRRLALSALRSILGGVAARAPLLLWLDDLHWTDSDSATLLTELLRAPDVPGFLLIASYRTDEGARNAALRGFVHAAEEGNGRTLSTSRIALSAMSPEEATALAEQVAASCHVPHIDAGLIARETGGNPFFVHELVRHAASRDEGGASGGGETTPTLEQALRERIAGLPEVAARMLELIAVAGGPVARAGIRVAAGLGEDENEALASLRAGHFVSTQGSVEELVETYHDRIRETVIAGLTEARRRALHLELARSLVALHLGDPQTLAEHFAEGGARREARRHAAQAAQEAMRTLAFDRAAELYRMVLELTDDGPEGDAPGDRLAIQRSLGDALANSGRGDQAAREYLAVAGKQRGLAAVELRRLAAEHLLITGRFEEGKAALGAVLRHFGLSLARSKLRALASLLWNRARIRLRGLAYAVRDARQIPDETLARIDACWAVAVGLGGSDFLQGTAFHARFVLLSLEAGEPHRLARAAAQEVAFLAIGGVKSRRGVERMLAIARNLAQQIGSAHALALSTVTAGLADYLFGRWPESFQLFESAERMLLTSGVGVQWELSMARRYAVSALWYLGELKELVRRLAIADAAARERGNLHAATNMQARFAHIERLAADAPDEAWARVDEAMKCWPENEFLFTHYNELVSRAQVLLYRGEGRAAWEYLQGRARPLKRSVLLRVELLRLEHRYLAGRCALAAALAAPTPGARSELLRAADACAEHLAREKISWTAPFAAILRAASAAQRREPAPAVIALLRDATAGFTAGHMRLYAAASKRRLGQQLQGEEGLHLVREADAFMSEQGIRSPARMTQMLVPGFPQ